jgi:uncharacterized protein YecE (DUF72 family)
MQITAPSRPQLRIGCSGWNYRRWRGTFYPPGRPPKRWLDYYASRFDTVEANATFYRLPPPEQFAAWRRQLPSGFVMAVKASRYLTHLKRLRDPEEPVERFFDHAANLGLRLGPTLYQLPGHFHKDLDRLRRFLEVIPERLRLGGRYRHIQHVVEFRHPSWYGDDVFVALSNRGVALCQHDRTGSVIEGDAVGPFVYVRFHGTSGDYHGSYGDAALRRWATRLARAWRDGRDVYAYFNNDSEAVATKNASTLRGMLDRATMDE